jgi:transcription-repair coupling factor (superfamily II helicase)
MARGASIRSRQRTTETRGTPVEFAPVSEVILDEAAITRFRQNYRVRALRRGRHRRSALRGRQRRPQACQGVEHWLPFFHERLETLFDYLPDAPITLDDQADGAAPSRWETIADQYDARAKTAMPEPSAGVDSGLQALPARGCSISTVPAGRARSTAARVLQFDPIPPRPARRASTPAGASGAASPPNARREEYLTEAQTLSPGDLVVHVDHGVGRYTGLETIEAMGAPHECLALEYARRRQALPAGREHRASVALRLGRGSAARQAGRRRLAGARRS